MSAQMIIPQAEADQGFGLLKDIVEMVKNPDAIDEAYKRRQEAAKLTDDEVAKAAEARSLIVKADSLRAELKQREETLQIATQAHAKNLIEFSDKIRDENEKLQARSNELQAISDAQSAIDQKQNALAVELDSRTKEIQDNHAQWEQLYENRIAKIEETETAQEEENTRLEAWAKKLQAKAARLAAEAESDE